MPVIAQQRGNIGQINTLPVPVKPTLFIGLGGSGKEVLVRLRRLFYEKYRMTGLPIMEYLWFDTDTAAGGIGGRKFDLIDQKVNFTQTEKIDARITPAETNAIWGNPGNNSHLWKWLERDRLQNAASVGIIDGAKQIRPFGRLAFFHTFSEVEGAIRTKLARIQDVTQRNQTMQITNPAIQEVNQDVEIIIVASLAGGTGSGCFLDFGFLCKNLSPNSLVTGYFFLPQVFSAVGGIDRNAVFANGYAALKELNHYLLPQDIVKNDDTVNFAYRNWDFEWRPGDVRSIPAPPFNVCYLVDSVNQNGTSTQFDDNFQMVSESLLLDFEGNHFSNLKRSWRSNSLAFLHSETIYLSENVNGEKEYSEVFPNRFSAFGLTQIQFNQARIANAAGYLFGQELIAFWLKENPVGGFSFDFANLEFTQKQAIARLITKADGTNFVTLRNNSLNQRATETIQNAVNIYNKLNTANLNFEFWREILNLINPNQNFARPLQTWKEVCEKILEVLPEFYKQLNNALQNLIDEIQRQITNDLQVLGGNGMVNGTDTLTFLQNKNAYQQNLFTLLEKQLLDFLSNPVNFGVSFCERFLDEADLQKNTLRNYFQTLSVQTIEPVVWQNILLDDFRKPDKTNLSTVEKNAGEAKDLWAFPFGKQKDYFEQRLNDEKERYDAAYQKQIISYLSNAFSGVLQRFNQSKQDLINWIKNRYEKELAFYFLEVSDKLENKINDERNKLQTFQRNLKTLATSFQTQFDAFNTPLTGTRNYYINLDWQREQYLAAIRQDYLQNLSQKTDDFFRKNLIPAETAEGGQTREGFRQLSDRSLVYLENPARWNEAKESLEKFSLETLAGFSANIQTVAAWLAELGTNNPQELNQILNSALSNSSLKVRKATHPEHLFQQDGRVLKVLGISPTTHNLATRLREGQNLNQNFPDFQSQVQDYGTESIILYHERVAFPLFLPEVVQEFRKVYWIFAEPTTKIVLGKMHQQAMFFIGILIKIMKL